VTFKRISLIGLVGALAGQRLRSMPREIRNGVCCGTERVGMPREESTASSLYRL